MAHPIVSCIVPVFNGEAYLREALDSILEQTYPALEVIVADDGSTDGTAAIVASYRNRVGSITDVNIAQTQLLQARNASTDSHSTALSAAATLALATAALGSGPR